jgi:uncharacterized metal-binding protein
MPETNCGCGCSAAPTLIFPCSGAADVGEISDRVARKLTREGAGKMFCLAGVGAHVDNFLMSTRAAGKILVIDGCPVDCAKNMLRHVGFEDITHMRVTDLGCEKGKSSVSEDTIAKISAHGKSMLIPEV